MPEVNKPLMGVKHLALRCARHIMWRAKQQGEVDVSVLQVLRLFPSLRSLLLSDTFYLMNTGQGGASAGRRIFEVCTHPTG
jgi:hypothetical protein